jgi:hypothetical protein
LKIENFDGKERKEQIMQLVYATGRPRQMEFGITSSPNLLPTGAEIYAVYEGDRADRRLDEQTFVAMSDEEFYTFQSLANVAEQNEARRASAAGDGLMNKLFRLLRGQ